MLENLHIEKEYFITFKRKILSIFTSNKSFNIEPYVSEIDLFEKEYQLKKIEYFSMFNIEVDKVSSYREVILKDMKYIDRCNLWIYSVTIKDDIVNILEIMDIGVNKKYRSLGIGTQLMNIINSICLENKIKYIIGELQVDREDEPLVGRKNFFLKKGFEIQKNDNSKHSGYIIKKSM